MSFREKIHWVAFFSMTLAFGWYFLTYPWARIATLHGFHMSRGMLYLVILAIIGLMTLATALLAVRTPKEVLLKQDERDRTIHTRGTHLAYYPLVLGVWANVFAIFSGISGAVLFNLLLATAVLAELIRIGAQIYYYRRGY